VLGDFKQVANQMALNQVTTRKQWN